MTSHGTLLACDVDGGSSRAVTVAQLQHALRAAITAASTNSRRPAQEVASAKGSPAAEAPATRIGTDIYVVGAHSGAGASTVALALADVAGSAGPVHLIERCRAGRSGLASAADFELGEAPDGAWRRGHRGPVVIDRPLTDVATRHHPPSVDGRRVVDLGAAGEDAIPAGVGIVLVCRATVPGVRAAEAWLTCTPNVRPIVIAAVGRPRWPGPVRATVGPRLRDVRANGQIVTVPVDRHLETNGPNSGSLPKAVLAAARTITSLLPTSQAVAS